MKLPISAIVVGLNEGSLLRACLPRLSICDELLYFDLGSQDDSIEVARRFGAQVIQHEPVTSCEWIHAEYASRTRHPWILITDPDEVIGTGLVQEILELFAGDGLAADIGAVSAPWQFYFGRQKLRGTPWGGINRRLVLAHRDRFLFRPLIHVGREVKPGYRILELEPRGDNLVHHYWMRNVRQLLAKHRRYLVKEGEARFTRGQRTTWIRIALEPLRAFKHGFLVRRGYRDGLLGFLLCCFWAWYQTMAEISLRKYMLQVARTAQSPHQRHQPPHLRHRTCRN
jgi:hypothetical protein